MAKLSQNISSLVFRRNIPFKLETYVLNCDMLQVLVEMDGIKNVAAIAANLNRPVKDLVTTFATLYQQKLIFLVKPNPTIVTQSDSPDKTSYKFNEIDFSKSDILPNQQQRNRPIDPPPSAEVIGKKGPLFRKNSNISKPSANPLSVRAEIDHPSQQRIVGIAKTPPPRPTAKLIKTEPKTGENRFRVATSKKDAWRNVPKPRLPSRPINKGLVQKKNAAISNKNKMRPYPNERAIEYFEKGLAYLQRRSYKEALNQFEMTLKLDPDNRLCRANIQRIRKLLKTDKYESLKRTH